MAIGVLGLARLAHATALTCPAVCPNCSNPACLTGFPLYFGDVAAAANNSDVGNSSPTVADLDGNGRKEIIVGSQYGVFVYSSNGSFAWAFPTDVPMGTKPAVGDLDGTGEQQVVVTTGSIATEPSGGTLYVLHHDGSFKCSYHYEAGTHSSPALAHLDPSRPDKLEITFGIWGGTTFHILALNPDCSVYWDKSHSDFVVDSVWSSPAVADLDGDGQLDVVIGQDSNLQTINGFTTPNGGMLRAFRGNGVGELPGFPLTFDEVIWSSPAIGPIVTRDALSVVAGNGRCWDVPACAPQRNTHPVTEAIYAWNATGGNLPGWPHATAGRDARTISPALADLDENGIAEVVMSVKIKTTDGLNDLYGEMHVLDGTGSDLSGWPVQPNIPATCGTDAHWVSEASPIVADLKGDGHYEIILPTNTEVVVWDANGTQLSRDHTSACTLTPDPSVYRLLGVGRLASSAVAADLDGSGQISIIAGGNYKDTSGKTWGALNVWKFPGLASPRSLPWSEFRHDGRNTGFYLPDEIFVNGFEP